MPEQMPRPRRPKGLVPALGWADIFNYYYCYYCVGTWVDLDERKRPKTGPALPVWATPNGWKRGLRPEQGGESPIRDPRAPGNAGADRGREERSSLILEIEALAEPLGQRMYRGRAIARVWNPVTFKMQDCSNKCWHTCKPLNGVSADWMRRWIVLGQNP